MKTETITALLFHRQLTKLANCDEEQFESFPYITVGIPDDSKIEKGFRLRVKTSQRSVEFTVASVLAAWKSTTPNYMTYKLKVSRKVLQT